MNGRTIKKKISIEGCVASPAGIYGLKDVLCSNQDPSRHYEDVRIM